MRITLFKLPKPKKFSFKPRHYDPVMEDLHNRIDMLKAELKEDDTQEYTSSTRLRIRKAWNASETRKVNDKNATFRIALIFFILFALFFTYIFTDIIS